MINSTKTFEVRVTGQYANGDDREYIGIIEDHGPKHAIVNALAHALANFRRGSVREVTVGVYSVARWSLNRGSASFLDVSGGHRPFYRWTLFAPIGQHAGSGLSLEREHELRKAEAAGASVEDSRSLVQLHEEREIAGLEIRARMLQFLKLLDEAGGGTPTVTDSPEVRLDFEVHPESGKVLVVTRRCPNGSRAAEYPISVIDGATPKSVAEYVRARKDLG